jgi:hypothetical protein
MGTLALRLVEVRVPDECVAVAGIECTLPSADESAADQLGDVSLDLAGGAPQFRTERSA